MSTVTDVMVALKTQLAAAYPARRVTRDMLDFSDRAEADLKAGIYTLVEGNEDGFPNYRGREGNFGTLHPVIVGQIQVDEKRPGVPSEIADAENAMRDEITAFTCLPLAAPIDSLIVKNIRRSGQMEYPYGWIACELELMLQ